MSFPRRPLKRWLCRDCYLKFEDRHELDEHRAYVQQRYTAATAGEKAHAASVEMRRVMTSVPIVSA